MSNKPSVLVLGGCGFIGRNLVTYLVEQSLCSVVRVIDKVLPATAYLTNRQKKAFESVDFKQGNLVNPGKLMKAQTAVEVLNG
jgi:nucleoside-diphosphate-sugar epimerase